QLNTETGQIIPIEEFDDIVDDVLKKLDGKLLDNVPGLAYIPHSLELIVIRLWEWLEEALSYHARLVKVRITEHNDFFVEYDGRREVIQPIPQPQLQPQQSRRKERK